MKRLYILTLCSVCLAACIFLLKDRKPTTVAVKRGLALPKEWLMSNKNPTTPKADQRPADQTFLTFPEWFLVFSPNEQASYFKDHTSTSFPFMSHTAQIWESYAIVNDQIKDNFPTNTGYHFMIWVIGTSASTEYAIKAWYETLIGRLTDTEIPITDEDKFNARFTQSYVNFIKDRPWYEYNFKKELSSLWTDVPLIGNNLVRKTERRYILTSELLVKWVYGKLIGLGTSEVYEKALPTTTVVLEDGKLHSLPRYDRFMPEAEKRAVKGHSFKEIAGNNSAILVSVLAPAETKINLPNTVTLFEQPVASKLTTKRIAIVTPVTHLSELLKSLEQEKITLEHIFDY